MGELALVTELLLLLLVFVVWLWALLFATDCSLLTQVMDCVELLTQIGDCWLLVLTKGREMLTVEGCWLFIAGWE